MLLDWKVYAERKGIEVAPVETRAIGLEDLRAAVDEAGITISRGDILFVRSGFTAVYERLSDSERIALGDRENPGYAGVEATREVARWLWDLGVSAVAGDAISWEAFPLGWKEGGNEDEVDSLHQWLLAGWGMPIGEMFDLETGAALQGAESLELLSVERALEGECVFFNLHTLQSLLYKAYLRIWPPHSQLRAWTGC